jgi:hypothetical protein
VNINGSDFIAFLSVISKYFNIKKGGILIGVIILEIYLVPLISIISGKNLDTYVILLDLHSFLAYTIIVFSIVFYFDDLSVFRDYFSLGFIVITCFFRVNLGGSYGFIYKCSLILLGLVLLGFIIKNRTKIKIPGIKSFLIGLLWSLGTVLAVVFLHLLLDSNHGTLPTNVGHYIRNQTLFELSFTTVIEEAFFRGLLFSLLVLNGCRENKALIIQAFLFWGVHYMDITDPILFFGVLPLLTISATFLLKKYKMLYSTIIMHTMNNVLAGILIALF